MPRHALLDAPENLHHIMGQCPLKTQINSGSVLNLIILIDRNSLLTKIGTLKGKKTVGTILKGLLLVCVFIMALAVLPVSNVKATDTELFVYKSPDFTVTLPKGWTKSDDNLSPGSILKKILPPQGIPAFEIIVGDIPEGMTNKDLVKNLIEVFENKFEGSNFQPLYERELKLKDGTPAYELEVNWKHPMILLYTYELVVFKDKKMIVIGITSNEQVNDQLKQISLSLAFN